MVSHLFLSREMSVLLKHETLAPVGSDTPRKDRDSGLLQYYCAAPQRRLYYLALLVFHQQKANR